MNLLEVKPFQETLHSDTGIFTLMCEELDLKTLHDAVLEVEKKTGGPLGKL